MCHLRVRLVVLTWVLASLVIGNTAFAEGKRNTYVEDVYTGFNSSSWNDRDKDKKKTKISFYNCRINAGGVPSTFETVTVELRQINDFRPDDSYGTKTLDCFNSATGNWGRVREQSHYKFRINLINGEECCRSMDADPVRIRW